jgi:hypothetical protein
VSGNYDDSRQLSTDVIRVIDNRGDPHAQLCAISDAMRDDAGHRNETAEIASRDGRHGLGEKERGTRLFAPAGELFLARWGRDCGRGIERMCRIGWIRASGALRYTMQRKTKQYR